MSSASEEFERTPTSAADPCPSRGSDGLVNCAEFDDIGEIVLTVVNGGEAVAELIRKDGGSAELRVLPSESFLDAGCRVHVVDVQGEREAFVLIVAVRQHDGTIASVRKILFTARTRRPLRTTRTSLIGTEPVVALYQLDHAQSRGGHPRRRRPGLGEGAVPRPAPVPVPGHERVGQLVPVPRRRRRVHGHAHVPLRQPRHRHRLQEPVRRGRRLHRRWLPRRGVVLRRHHHGPRLLHRRRLRRAHQPGRDARAAGVPEADAGARRALRGGAVPRRHLRRGRREGGHGAQLRGPRRRRQRGGGRLLGGRGARRGGRRHVRARLRRPLRDRPQAHRARLLHPRPRAAADRLRGVRGAPGHHTHHRHGDQPGQEPGRRRDVQPAQSMERPLDLLGRAVHRSDGSGVVPPVRDARGGHQGAAELIQELRTVAAELIQEHRTGAAATART